MKDIVVKTMGNKLGTMVAHRTGQPHQGELLSFGAEIIIGCSIKLVFLFLLSSVFGVVRETFLILFVTGFLRTFSGGAHCNSYYKCLMVSSFVILGLSITVSRLESYLIHLPQYIILLVLLLSLILFLIYSPKAPLNKPLKNEAEKKKFWLLSILSAALFSFFVLKTGSKNIGSWLIAAGLLWQAFTLTPAGFHFIELFNLFKQEGGVDNV
ncbi:accessory gene regulator ArgB-like protein [Candidatus Contubernalis alkaliaceticus]|uniref:accessory gene regulator ArgB-like protein n=1 Tax=Candidatus Contubernalis alkaliaceticus TaxID=338645 RepID=UPI001F4BDE51|nr:accessory gene regulator B family protein [Candidatus Contubernalis alkalaceticus]UNC93152.1 accessory gene regulator B family protein [Candidatus Contubernalis alkalaceticus]